MMAGMKLTVLAPALLMACPTSDKGELPDTGSCGCSSDGGIEIGTGALNFQALVEHDPVTMVHGPQGGWHMLGSVRTHGMDSIVTVNYWITADGHGDAVVSDNRYRVAQVMDEDCSGYFPGMYGYLSVGDIAEGEADTPPELLADEAVTLHMAVEDIGGCVAEAHLQVAARPDPVDLVPVDTGDPVDTGGAPD